MATAWIVGMAFVLAVPQGDVLRTLRPEHPRLIALAAETPRVKQLVAEDLKAGLIYRRLKQEADHLLRTPPVERALVRRSSPTMLDVSRKCLDRVYTLATVYRIENDRQYAQRAIDELLAAADFPDWNPGVFLDAAEMTHALAIGYDWLFDALSPDQRRKIRRAIVNHGLREGQQAYGRAASWTRASHNWNLVCNGGMVLGALAVAEDEPQLASDILRRALASVPLALKEYSPDGGWAEGPGYWNYATRYAVYMMAALESALGTDFDLSRSTGFAETGLFCIHMTGPTRLAFNFADSGPTIERAPMMYWLARKFDKWPYAWHERESIGGASALDLWWFDSRGQSVKDLPKDRLFRHIEVAFMRSAWEDPRALFVGFKAGDNHANHSHLELGSFVLDAAGQRWVHAPGSDNYAAPGYFGAQRWSYYRTNTHGQNTLMIDDRDQDPKAAALITAFHSADDRAHAVAELSAAYAGQARRVRRGIALIDARQRVLVQDELEGLRGAEVVWQIHTKATIELHGNRALLRQGRETVDAQILAPADGEFSVEAVDLAPPQRPMPDVRRLIIRRRSCEGDLRLAVLFTPGGRSDAPAGVLAPLENWPGRENSR